MQRVRDGIPIGEPARFNLGLVWIKYQTDFSINGHVGMAPGNDSDPNQQWIMDTSCSVKVKDEPGCPAFALVNRATGQALRHGKRRIKGFALSPLAGFQWQSSRVFQTTSANEFYTRGFDNRPDFESIDRSGYAGYNSTIGAPSNTFTINSPRLTSRWRQNNNQNHRVFSNSHQKSPFMGRLRGQPGALDPPLSAKDELSTSYDYRSAMPENSEAWVPSKTSAFDQGESSSYDAQYSSDFSGNFEDDEDIKKPKQVGLLGLFAYSNGSEKILMILGSLGAFVNGGALPWYSLLFGKIVKEIGSGSQDSLITEVRKICLYMVGLSIIVTIGAYLQITCWTISGERMTRRIRTKYLRAVLRQDIEFFDTGIASGDMMQSLATDVTQIPDATGEKVDNGYADGPFRQSVLYFHFWLHCWLSEVMGDSSGCFSHDTPDDDFRHCF